jgi:hypothetical protein
MCTLLPCILGSNVLTDLLCVGLSTFGVNKDLIKFGDNKDKLFEKGPHFDNNEVFPSNFLFVKALNLGNYIEIFEGADGIKFELADLDGVEDSVVKIKNEDSSFGL